MNAARFLVRGKVQGVWFRAATREQALALGLVGYAQNLPDGAVEVLACGPSQAIDQLEAWLAIGPPLAKVTEVVRQPAAGVDPPGEFSTR
jgi:acylphosphatase